MAHDYWAATMGPQTARFPDLQHDLEVDVAVVGGGIVGLTAAELLRRSGRRVAVLEARRIGGQATGKSTAKITSQHGLAYRRLIDRAGEDGARAYGAGNEAALARIAGFVEELGIDCAFERRRAFVYSRSEDQVATLQAEAEAARRLGLPASFTRDVPLPFVAAGAVMFDAQAQFNPARYLLGLATAAAPEVQVLEGVRAMEVEHGEPCVIRTEAGPKVRARDVILATQMPIGMTGMHFAKAYPFCHPMAAARIEPSRAPDGMFISTGAPSHSFRADRSSGDTYLVAAGGSYKTGHEEEETALFEELERFLRDTFGVTEIAYRWSNQDFKPMDGLPFVGRASSGTEHLYVATGFGAWGITNGTAAGMLLSDLILGRPNPLADLLDATRLSAASGGAEFLKENLHVAQHFASGRLFPGRPREVDLAPGGAGIFKVDGEQTAVCRETDGSWRAVSAICTHLGCVVGWNPVDRTWDCPCHGSRFARDGKVISGPATQPLEPRAVAPESGG